MAFNAKPIIRKGGRPFAVDQRPKAIYFRCSRAEDARDEAWANSLMVASMWKLARVTG